MESDFFNKKKASTEQGQIGIDNNLFTIDI